MNNGATIRIMLDYVDSNFYPEFYSFANTLANSRREIALLSKEEREKISELYTEICDNIGRIYHERQTITKFKIERIFDKNKIIMPDNTDDIMQQISKMLDS